MAKKQIVLLEDDIQGGDASQTLRFAFDGAEYEIDLNEKNAAKMREAFGFYVDHARRRTASKSGRASVTGVDNMAVRAWAASNRIVLSARGRIPANVIEQFRSAGN